MKRSRITYSFIVLAAIFAFTIGAKDAEAYPLSVTGYASPNEGSITSIGGGLSTVDVYYTFKVIDNAVSNTDPDVGITNLTLEFEKTAFNSVDSIYVTSPGDWNNFLSAESNTIIYEFASGGTLVTLGNALDVAASVTIIDNALTDGSLWNEGDIWQQSFGGTSSPGGFFGDSFGGSTIATPEPTSMFLLGAGIMGLVGVRARKKLKQKKKE